MAMEAGNDLKFFPIKRRQLNAFRRLAAPHLKGRIADLGAGSGPYHRELQSCTIVSLDYAPPPFRWWGRCWPYPLKTAASAG